MKILVTGAGGQLGAALINSLIQIPGLCIVSTTKDELDVSNKNLISDLPQKGLAKNAGCTHSIRKQVSAEARSPWQLTKFNSKKVCRWMGF